MNLTTIVIVLIAGFILGMYVLAQIEKRIDNNNIQKNMDKFDRSEYPRTGALQSDYKIKKK